LTCHPGRVGRVRRLAESYLLDLRVAPGWHGCPNRTRAMTRPTVGCSRFMMSRDVKFGIDSPLTPPIFLSDFPLIMTAYWRLSRKWSKGRSRWRRHYSGTSLPLFLSVGRSVTRCMRVTLFHGTAGGSHPPQARILLRAPSMASLRAECF